MDPHRASGVPRPRHGPRTTPSRAAAHYLREALQRGAPAPKPRARTTRRATTFKSTEPGAKRERTPRPARWAHPRVLPKGCLNLSIADWLIASPFDRRPRSYRAERGNVLAACPCGSARRIQLVMEVSAIVTESHRLSGGTLQVQMWCTAPLDAPRGADFSPSQGRDLDFLLERTTGFEPATLTLASRYWRELANASDR